jgi:hypothetical protein
MDLLNTNVTDLEHREVIFFIKQEFDKIKQIEKSGKHVGCLILIRNSLRNGNRKVTALLKSTNLDKNELFDKIYTLMYRTCMEYIDKNTIENVK